MMVGCLLSVLSACHDHGKTPRAAVDIAPSATNLTFEGTTQPGTTISISYVFFDEHDTEGQSLFSWAINGVLTADELSFNLPNDSEGKILTFCLTPVATGGPEQDKTECIERQILGQYSIPIINNLTIEPFTTDVNVTASYDFLDDNDRHEGAPIYSWIVDNVVVSGQETITLSKDKEGKMLSLCITPIAASGENPHGDKVCTEQVIILPKVGSSPTIENLALSAFAKAGNDITVNYDFVDVDNDLQGEKAITWSIEGVEIGLGEIISLPDDSAGKLLSACITPQATTGLPASGVKVCTQNHISPTVTTLAIDEKTQPGASINATYLFVDEQGSVDQSIYKWLIDGVVVADTLTFTLPTDSEGKNLSFCLTSVATSEQIQGKEVCVEKPITGQYSAPTVTNLIVPPTTTDVNVNPTYNFVDANNRLEGVPTYSWLVDGNEVGNQSTINLAKETQGKLLSMCITPTAISGKNAQGTPVCSTPITIGAKVGTAPVINNLSLSTFAKAGNSISVNYDYVDADNDAQGTNSIVWSIEGTQFSNDTTITLPNDSAGKLLSVCLSPSAITGLPASGVQVCLQDHIAPTVTTLAIAATTQPGTSIDATYVFVDEQGSVDQSIYEWRIDGVVVASTLSFTLPSDSEGKSLTFCLTPVATSDQVQGKDMCVTKLIAGQYTFPGISNLIIPATTTGIIVAPSYTFIDANSRLEGTSIYSWLVDGIEAGTQSTINLPNTTEGKQLSVCVTPTAISGENPQGVQVCSASISIAAKVGTAPTVNNLAFSAFAKAGDDVSINYDYVDADNDAQATSLIAWSIDGTEVSQNTAITLPGNSAGKLLSVCITPSSATGLPVNGTQACTQKYIANIEISGELELFKTINLDIKGYTYNGVTWKILHPTYAPVRSTSDSSFIITGTIITESATWLVANDIEVCVDTIEEGELCFSVAEQPTSLVTGGMATELDAGHNITKRVIAPVSYIDLTIGLVTKRLHRPLNITESTRLNAITAGAVPLHTDNYQDNTPKINWTLYNQPTAVTHCTSRGFVLPVQGHDDTSDLFGLKQYYAHIQATYPQFTSSGVTNAMGWPAKYFRSSSFKSATEHYDFYLSGNDPSYIDDVDHEAVGCLSTVP